MSKSVSLLFKIISLTAMAMVAAIVFIVLPDRVWNTTSSGAFLLFCLSVGMAFYSPILLPASNDGNDAGQIASIGMIIFVLPALIVMSAIAFLLALTGFETIVWVLLVLTVGTFVILISLINAAAAYINQISAGTANASSKTEWLALLQSMNRLQMSADVKAKMNSLMEKIQYAASDSVNLNSTLNSDIGQAVDKLYQSLLSGSAPDSDVSSLIENTLFLVEKREALLKTARTKS